ncbi:MAG: DUF1743 domain-containing protein, partial [Candidatus Hodarchaeota archaeon]
MEQIIHIGIDDTDSPNGGCTTYLAALLVSQLTSNREFVVTFIDYPNLIRLNPNIPFRTRGNGAICLRMKTLQEHVPQIKDLVCNLVKSNSDLTYGNTNPGIAIHLGTVHPALKLHAKKTIQSVVSIKQAESTAKETATQLIKYKNGRGVIGALAAIGEPLHDDHTFELITYRTTDNCGTPRRVDPDSVYNMDKSTYPNTYANFDPTNKRILITPNGPDPILYGIRGETPQSVHQAHKLIKVNEPIERWVIFRTNHGTDHHIPDPIPIGSIRPYQPVNTTGSLNQLPRTIPGGHVISKIHNNDEEIHIAAYYQTGNLRKRLLKLIPGDTIRAIGGVRPPTDQIPITINLEKVEVLDLVPNIKAKAPTCPQCHKTMKSDGREKGYKCIKCHK